MSVYLGELGRMVELRSPSSQAVAVDDGTVFEQTLEGRVKAQVRSARRRSWSVNVDAATPADLANLLAFAGGEWGKGPFVWVSTDAPVTNLLAPEGSLGVGDTTGNTNALRSGPMDLGAGGWAGSSMTAVNPSALMWMDGTRVPVLQGQSVTGSAWVLGASAKVRLHWYAANGSTLATVSTSPGSGVAGEARRLHVTATPPAGAASCALSVINAAQATRPAITWTDTLFDWQPGEGCPKAVIHGLSKQVILALRDPAYGRYANASFTITEVG